MRRRYRLTDKERFRQVRQTGVSYSHPLLVICLLPNDLDFSRCGFTASRRLGKAVERNRARRRMSEAVRLLWDLVLPGWDLVFVARSGIHRAEFLEIQQACVRLLQRARAMRVNTASADSSSVRGTISATRGENQTAEAEPAGASKMSAVEKR